MPSRPGGAWRERWPGLTMRTVNGVYELPGRPLPSFDADEPAYRALTRYFGDYERDLGLPVQRSVQVRRVRDLGGPEHLLGGVLRDAVEETLRARLLARTTTDLTVRLAHRSDDIVLRGAAVLVLWDQLGVA